MHRQHTQVQQHRPKFGKHCFMHYPICQIAALETLAADKELINVTLLFV